jgi:hypothetical protein
MTALLPVAFLALARAVRAVGPGARTWKFGTLPTISAEQALSSMVARACAVSGNFRVQLPSSRTRKLEVG